MMPVGNENKMPFMSVGDMSIHSCGKTYQLNPKKDMTAFELYNVNKFIKNCELNRSLEANPFLISMIDELEILRHFDVTEYKQ